MALTNRDTFYKPQTYQTVMPKVPLHPRDGAPKAPAGQAVLPLSQVLTITNNIQAAIKAHRDGKISLAHGDPLDFVLKMAEDLRTMAIRATTTE